MSFCFFSFFFVKGEESVTQSYAYQHLHLKDLRRLDVFSVP